ncbi:MAG: radical SAM protein [Filifactoraceae bacterium]
MEKHVVKYAETMVSWGCNLSCVGCSNFCDYPHSGFEDYDNFESDLIVWSEKVTFEAFGLMGGEPFLNKELDKWIFGTRRILTDSHLVLVTNGTLLENRPEVIDWLHDVSPCTLLITLHSKEKDILESISRVLSQSKYRFFKNDKTEALTDIEYILLDGKRKFNIQVMETDTFLKRYKGYGKKIYPFDTTDIETTHENCIDRPLLYKGNLYKCSKMALLKKQLEFNGQLGTDEDSNPWLKYLDYNGISHNLSNDKLRDEIESLYSSFKYCSSCPIGTEEDSIVRHKENVFSSGQWKKLFWSC